MVWVVLSLWLLWSIALNLLLPMTSCWWKANKSEPVHFTLSTKQSPNVFVCVRRRAVLSMATCVGSSCTSQESVRMSALPSRSSTLWHRPCKVRSQSRSAQDVTGIGDFNLLFAAVPPKTLSSNSPSLSEERDYRILLNVNLSTNPSFFGPALVLCCMPKLGDLTALTPRKETEQRRIREPVSVIAD